MCLCLHNSSFLLLILYVWRYFFAHHLCLRHCMRSNGLPAVRSSLGSTDGIHPLQSGNFRMGGGGALRVLGVTSTVNHQRWTAGRCRYRVPRTLPPVVDTHYWRNLDRRLWTWCNLSTLDGNLLVGLQVSAWPATIVFSRCLCIVFVTGKISALIDIYII